LRDRPAHAPDEPAGFKAHGAQHQCRDGTEIDLRSTHADRVAFWRFVDFIIIYLSFLVGWMALIFIWSHATVTRAPFDPFRTSCSPDAFNDRRTPGADNHESQNRAAEKDRWPPNRFKVNLKAN